MFIILIYIFKYLNTQFFKIIFFNSYVVLQYNFKERKEREKERDKYI